MQSLSLHLLLLLLTSLSSLSHAQEAPNPAFRLEHLDESAPGFRQNVCDRQAAFSAGQVTLAQALEGLELRPAIGLNQYFALNDNGVIPPENPLIVVELLDELSRRAGFTSRTKKIFYPRGKPTMI